MSSDQKNHLKVTRMLDFHDETIEQLIEWEGWRTLSQYEAIGAIYNFVRDEIAFGYNQEDTLSASQVLAERYGQCNTKGTLLIALLRGVGIPARLHGFSVHKALQKGAIPHYLFMLAPKRIVHSWVEVYFEGRWLNLEGYIVDKEYLAQVQKRFAGGVGSFSGYGVATKDLKNPDNIWRGGDTYIQKEGISSDLGVYDQPDDFYQKNGSNINGVKGFLYRHMLRHLINFNVRRIRLKGIAAG